MQMGFEPSGVARGSSGGTHPEAQDLETHHHTFYSHLKAHFKQSMLKNAYL